MSGNPNSHADRIKLESGVEQYGLLGLDTTSQGNTQGSTTGSTSSFQSGNSKQRWNESPQARTRRLARNAERMRERRSRETDDEYRARLTRNAEANRMRRQNESEVERAMRLVRNAARQRLRRAMETPEQRSKRLSKLAERMRIYRANESPDQRKIRLAEMAARARERISRESSEERKERLRKLSDYAKKVRANKNVMKVLTNSTTSQLGPSQSVIEENSTIACNQQPQQHPTYPQQTLTNSIEYYQNMFINSALRQNQLTSSQTSQQTSRFHTNLQPVSIESNIFQPGVYDTPKSIPKVQTNPFQTLTSSIEYYQNKYIKNDRILSTKEPTSSTGLEECKSKRDDNLNSSTVIALPMVTAQQQVFHQMHPSQATHNKVTIPCTITDFNLP